MTDPIERARKAYHALTFVSGSLVVEAMEWMEWENAVIEAFPILLEKADKLEAELGGPPACWCGKPLEVAGGMPEDGKNGTRFYVCPEHRELYGHYGQWYYKQRLDAALAAIREYELAHPETCERWCQSKDGAWFMDYDNDCTCGRDERQAKLLEGE